MIKYDGGVNGIVLFFTIINNNNSQTEEFWEIEKKIILNKFLRLSETLALLLSVVDKLGMIHIYYATVVLKTQIISLSNSSTVFIIRS